MSWNPHVGSVYSLAEVLDHIGYFYDDEGPKKQEPVAYITPPDEGEVTDNDSADENEDGGFDVSKVGWKTLQGEAEVVIYDNHTSVNEQETGLMQASPVQPVEQDIQDIITEKTQTVTPKRLRATSNRKCSGTSKSLDDSTDASSKHLEHPRKRKQTCLPATKSKILPSTKTAQITPRSDKRKILSATQRHQLYHHHQHKQLFLNHEQSNGTGVI